MLVAYLLAIILLFLLINFLEQKLRVRYLHEVLLTLIYFLIVGGIFYEFHFSTKYLYTVMLFVAMIEIFLLYYKELSSSRNPYSFYKYLFLVMVIYLFNRVFVDRVKGTFLSLEEMKAFIWILVVLYLYWYGRKLLFNKRSRHMVTRIKDDYLMIQYVHLKNEYRQDISVKNKSLLSLIYAILLYESMRRPFFLRRIDIILYRLDGLPRKFGIMQIKSSNVLSDEESIKRGVKKIATYDQQVSSSFKAEDRYFKILKKYHYQEEEILDIIAIWKRISFFEDK